MLNCPGDLGHWCQVCCTKGLADDWTPYLLVVSYEDEVLAGSAQRGDGMSFQDLGRLLHDHQARVHLLQNLTEPGRPRGRHADDLGVLQDAYGLLEADLGQALGRILVGLLRFQNLLTNLQAVAAHPRPAETERGSAVWSGPAPRERIQPPFIDNMMLQCTRLLTARGQYAVGC